MKRICFFSGDITRSGGTEKVGTQIAKGLCDQFDVTIISLTEENKELFYDIDSRVKHHALFDKNPDGIKQYISIVHRLRKFLVTNNIDVLIDIDTMLDMFAVPAAKLSKTKLIAWEHFNFFETMGNKLRVPIRKYITKFADCVVALTKEDQKNFLSYYGNGHRVEQIYNPIEIPASEHIYDMYSKIIISAGRLAYQKGFDMLIDVADIVLKKHTDWRWIILGEGDMRQELEKKIDCKKLHNLRLWGRVENVSEYMKKAAIYVMTSRYEGFPLVLIEAKASKLPVVSFKCATGPAELVQEDVNGNLVECFDIAAMADRINSLIENEEIRQCFSDNALLDTDKMNYKNIIQQWIKLIDKI